MTAAASSTSPPFPPSRASPASRSAADRHFALTPFLGRLPRLAGGERHEPAVVLIHGFGNTGDMWSPMAPARYPWVGFRVKETTPPHAAATRGPANCAQGKCYHSVSPKFRCKL
jgi:pimeloyl-ACP methyl ester carboxylesterase